MFCAGSSTVIPLYKWPDSAMFKVQHIPVTGEKIFPFLFSVLHEAPPSVPWTLLSFISCEHMIDRLTVPWQLLLTAELFVLPAFQLMVGSTDFEASVVVNWGQSWGHIDVVLFTSVLITSDLGNDSVWVIVTTALWQTELSQEIIFLAQYEVFQSVCVQVYSKKSIDPIFTIECTA